MERRLVFSTLPTGFGETVVASQIADATAMQFSPDGKLFVAEQGGRLQVWSDGTRIQSDFFTDNPLQVNGGGEQGLLGLAFDPGYAVNRFIYVYYTTITDRHNRVSRFTANTDGNKALSSSELVVMDLDPHEAGNHNGGAMHFGPDGFLYIATGDNAIGANAQSLENRHGKILRIDVAGDDFPADATQNYRIPADQPTSFPGINGTTQGLNRSIYMVGLRNPFTFSFQPGTGRQLINDVGQGSFEEIDQGAAGKNFGWPMTEGDFTAASFPDFTRPVFSYAHNATSGPSGIAITGGAFYSPVSAPFPAEYRDDYLFADFGSNQIWHLDLDTLQVQDFAANVPTPVDLKVDDAGNLYYLARGSGQVIRVSYESLPPTILSQSQDQTTSPRRDVVFSVDASGQRPLTYQWQRAPSGSNVFADIPGATAESYTASGIELSGNGDRFRAVVSDASSRTTVGQPITLNVVSNLAPSAVININDGLRFGRFDAGTAISFSGSGLDPEDGDLPAANLSWEVKFLSTIQGGDVDHDGLPGLTRPFVPQFAGTASSTFTPAQVGPYTLTDVAYAVLLTVTDAQGSTARNSVVIQPNTATITLDTTPSNLVVTLDGQPFTGPVQFSSVVGFKHEIGTLLSQSTASQSLVFLGWSDGGESTHTLVTPTTDATYSAAFHSGGEGIRINFQPTRSKGFAGYLPDYGATFGRRRSGLSYGWNQDNVDWAFNRNSPSASDERYDTFAAIQKPGGARKWKILLPNGSYLVHIVSSDPTLANSINHFNIESTVVNDPDGKDHVDEFAVTVNVTAGKLIVKAAEGARNAKIAFIEIYPNSNDESVSTASGMASAFSSTLIEPMPSATRTPPWPGLGFAKPGRRWLQQQREMLAQLLS